ncbi:hypothetical protein OD917_16340 [Flavobacterium sp. SH_e]|uniref:hypothetical protein n=1 Tax=Flavobacterium sp. SH_e TaxID=2983767 RepID=UPI0021E4B11B|nr:hypothetical protein [Flavobacterium sp. SH_e]MCV2486504.1 hypothetical protein [Flavobacterium sp. SH_e]
MNIESYSIDLLNQIEKEIGYIRNGNLSNENIGDIKKAINRWFKTKINDERPRIGYVAEFICHLYLRSKNFEQYFLFKNLEENGPKKGFDGLYLFDNELWLLESKSTSSNLKTHNKKISEAYNNIKLKIESVDNEENNPWENAKNHIDNRNIHENKTLSKIIADLSSDYINQINHKIDEYNIIPCSTIFLGDNWKTIDNDDLKHKLESLCKKYKAKKLNLICINKKSIDDFIKFIDG